MGQIWAEGARARLAGGGGGAHGLRARGEGCECPVEEGSRALPSALAPPGSGRGRLEWSCVTRNLTTRADSIPYAFLDEFVTLVGSDPKGYYLPYVIDLLGQFAYPKAVPTLKALV